MGIAVDIKICYTLYTFKEYNMDKNLVIFFGDGESDNLDEKAIKLLKNSLGTEFLLLFRTVIAVLK